MKNLGMRNRLVCVVGIMAALLGLAQAASATLVTNIFTSPSYNNIWVFTTSVNLSSASGTWTVPAGVSSIAVLVVGGGGGGGGRHAGGGGGGGAVYATARTVTPGTSIDITVGGGGAGYPSNGAYAGDPGSNSVFGSLTAFGGGRGVGGNYSAGYADGGCGGGTGPGTTAGVGSQGYDGGGGVGSPNYTGGGGGGMGGVGTGASGDGLTAGDGGAGVMYDITGTATWYAAGGGGGTFYGNAGGGGGSGIGGHGSIAGSLGTPGAPHTGSGGGGGGNSGGYDGGSGIVIVAWDNPIIPEPSTVLLLALGGALVWRATKRL